MEMAGVEGSAALKQGFAGWLARALMGRRSTVGISACLSGGLMRWSLGEEVSLLSSGFFVGER